MSLPPRKKYCHCFVVFPSSLFSMLTFVFSVGLLYPETNWLPGLVCPYELAQSQGLPPQIPPESLPRATTNQSEFVVCGCPHSPGSSLALL